MKGVLFGLILLSLAEPIGARTRSSDPGGHTNQGVRYAQDKEYDKAIEAQPNDPKNYENRAMVYRLTDKPQQAIIDLSKIIELRPKDADLCNQGAD